MKIGLGDDYSGSRVPGALNAMLKNRGLLGATESGLGLECARISLSLCGSLVGSTALAMVYSHERSSVLDSRGHIGVILGPALMGDTSYNCDR